MLEVEVIAVVEIFLSTTLFHFARVDVLKTVGKESGKKLSKITH